MDAGSRYAELLGALAREEPLLRVPRELSEHELQAHWFAGDFGRRFAATTGEQIEIVQFGIWNRESGPDFAEASVSVDGHEPVRGCIELDPDARDWERHGHGANPDYERVILHVFMQRGGPEFFTRTASHRSVPQVLLDAGALANDPPTMQPSARPGRCVAPLRELSDERVRGVLLGAAEHRMKRKSAALARLTDLHGSDEALYQGLAAALGYKSNKLPFTLLAQRLPLRHLKSAPVEALLFGVAGFLPARDLSAYDDPARDYLRELWEQWWPLRAHYERLEIPPKLWRLSGQRPANHPQRRLAALAEIVRHWPKVRALRERCHAPDVIDFFGRLSHEFWDRHYTVSSKTSARSMALIGESRVVEMLANVYFPMAIREDPKRWIGFKNLPAPLSNRRVEIAALRLFGSDERARPFLRNAALQQGLLQIYEDFCMQDASDCARCRFPEQVARW
ncbi:MAG: DUF2851 family protein [Chthoniobacteraceae bacterium]